MASYGSGPILSLHDVALTERRAPAEAGTLNLELGHGTVTLVETGDGSDADLLIDLCLGLSVPARGDVVFLGEAWRMRSYHDNLGLRGHIGLLTGSQTWPADLSIAEAVLMARLYHTKQPLDDAIAAATILARRFGLPGLPAGSRESVPADQLTRSACVRAFCGTPELVLVSDSTLEGMAELGIAMAQAIAEVQDRGGAVLWLVDTVEAPAAHFVRADQTFRFGERGFVPARRTP